MLSHLLQSCVTTKQEQEEAVDTTLVTVDYEAQQREIDAAKAAEEERIKEEEKQAALKLERKDFRIAEAQRFMDALTGEYMTKLAPSSGAFPLSNLVVESYNDLTETIKINTTSSFLACTRGAGCDQKETHTFYGVITIMGDTGKIDYYLTSKNQTLQDSETYSNFWNGVGNSFADWLAEKIAEENSKNVE